MYCWQEYNFIIPWTQNVAFGYDNHFLCQSMSVSKELSLDQLAGLCLAEMTWFLKSLALRRLGLTVWLDSFESYFNPKYINMWGTIQTKHTILGQKDSVEDLKYSSVCLCWGKTLKAPHNKGIPFQEKFHVEPLDKATPINLSRTLEIPCFSRQGFHAVNAC